MFTLRFGDYEFPNQTFEIEGLPIENNIQEDNIARKHGSKIATLYLKSKNFSINGTIHNDSAESSFTQLVAMQAALLPAEGKFYYRADRYINCKAKNIKPQFKIGTDKAVMDIDVSLVAENPFQYSAGASYSTAETTDGTTKDFSIYSGGNVYSEPIYKFCAVGATISDDIQLTNTTTGEVFRFRGDIPPGSTLEVNTEDYTVEVDGIDGLSYFEGDFATLVAGTNSFQFVGLPVHLTVEHKYRWY